jgi:hypothetical protein
MHRTYLTCAEGLGWPAYALQGLVNRKQPNSDVTGGYLKLAPAPRRVPAQQVQDRLLMVAKVRRKAKQTQQKSEALAAKAT